MTKAFSLWNINVEFQDTGSLERSAKPRFALFLHEPLGFKWSMKNVKELLRKPNIQNHAVSRKSQMFIIWDINACSALF